MATRLNKSQARTVMYALGAIDNITDDDAHRFIAVLTNNQQYTIERKEQNFALNCRIFYASVKSNHMLVADKNLTLQAVMDWSKLFIGVKTCRHQ